MGKVYRTANGKMVDIDGLRLANEDTIAVGNMRVNARGDQLGPGGQVVQTRNQAMDQHYKISTPMADAKTSQQIQQENARNGVINAQGTVNNVPVEPDLDPDGLPFDAPEVAPASPPLRGSLADSIAKQTTVTQEPLVPPQKKPTGPSRI